jgi:protease-4
MATRWLWTLGLLGLAVPAQAQSMLGRMDSPFDVSLPAASVADCDDPAALLLNPAALTWAPAGEALFLEEERFSSESGTTRGRAFSLLLGLGGSGMGVQYVQPDSGDERREFLKYTLSLPLIRAGRFFSVGAGLEILDPARTSEDIELDWVVGAMLRPARFLSLGVVGRNLAEASVGGIRGVRTLDLGLAARPLWFDFERLTLSADVRLREGASDPAVRFSGRVRLIDGIELFGSVDLDGRFGAGVMLDFSNMAVGSYLGVARQGGPELGTVVTALRISSEARPGFVVRRGGTAVFVLDRELALEEAPSWRLWQRSGATVGGVARALRRAAEDPAIDSVLLKIADPPLGLTDVGELREAVGEVRRAGKKVFAYLLDADNVRYFLAAAADEIYLNPAGMMMVLGPAAQATFFAGTLDWLGVRVEALRIGKYKSAVEQFTEREPSEGMREVMKSLSDEAFDHVMGMVARDRGVTLDDVKGLLAQGLMRPQQALAAGWLDGVAYEDELEQKLGQALGHAVSLRADYLDRSQHLDIWGRIPAIAVVHATGSITGDGGVGGIQAGELAGLLARMRDDPAVAAVVLRVDSPGGSGAASEIIWREMVRLREKKPVIVSMSSVAASGGYFISTPAHVIVADPMTITGSIGVFVMFADLSRLYQSLGISHAVEKRGEHADLASTFRARTPEELEMIQKNIDAFYRDFLEKVAQGREMTVEDVDAIAQGRVWTGRQAAERGLVDELGGLSRAIEIAREKAGFLPGEPARVIHLPRERFSLRALLGELGIMEEREPLVETIERHIRLVASLAQSGPQPLAMLPWNLILR